MTRALLYNAKLLNPEKPEALPSLSAIWICDGRIERVEPLGDESSAALFESAAQNAASGEKGVAHDDRDRARLAGKTNSATLCSETTLLREKWSAHDSARVDLRGAYLAPGFIDLHYHGSLIFAAAKDFDTNLRQSSIRLAREGTTAFLPTTVTSTAVRLEEIFGALQPILQSAAKNLDFPTQWPGAVPLGLHLEGPWINEAAAGAQPKDAICAYDAAQGKALFARAENLIRMVTLAPEIPGATDLLRELATRGIVAALGHSQASAEQVETAIKLGARHVTHLFNAMKPLHHRDPGLVGVALTDPRLSFDLICDGVHLDSRIVRLAAAAKREKLALITDRIELPAAALSAQEKTALEKEPACDRYGFGAAYDDGHALRLRDGRLAGSSLSMNRAFRNAQSFGALTLCEAVAACTLHPARVLGIEAERGTLRIGAQADLVALDAEGKVLQTWIAGKPVWKSQEKSL